MTTPDWVPTMRRAAALVTDGGGMTCHAAIVSRELGVPCVVGDAQRDARCCATASWSRSTAPKGVVLAGDAPTAGVTAASSAAASQVAPTAVEPLATRIYVNLAMADQAEQVAALPVDGVGLLRAEFMITDALGGVHPRALLADGGRERVRRSDGARRSCASRARSRRGRSSTAPSTSAPTSSASSKAAQSSSRSRRTR